MALSRPEVIDFVILSRDRSSVDLIIYDEGEIREPERRFEALQRKLVSFANYVADGQYVEQAPGIAAERVAIRVACQTQPTEKMRTVVAFRASDSGVRVADLALTIETETEHRARIELESRDRHGQGARTGNPWWKFW